MRRILIACQEMFPALVLMVLILAVLNLIKWKNWKQTVGYGVFALYLAIVTALVGLPNIGYVRLGCNFQLIPFVGILGDLKNSILNVAMFLPLGFLLPSLWEKFRSWKAALWEGFCVSLFIEVMQIFTFRATDVNDLITNTLGTMLGFCIARCIPLKGRSPSRDRFWLYGLVLFTRMVAFPILWHWIYG